MAIIKADLEGLVRLAELSADELTVSHVRRHLGEVFNKPMLDGYELYYVADDDETVLIDSDEEFLAGLCENGSPFRLTVVQCGHDMQLLASCGLSLLEETELSVSGGGVPHPSTPQSALSAPVAAQERKEIVGEHTGAGDNDDDESVDDEEERDNVSEDEDDNQDDKHVGVALAFHGLAASNYFGEEATEEAQPTSAREQKQNKEVQERQPQQQPNGATAELLTLATTRLRQRASALANLQVEQLQRFMDILHFELPKLVKCGILAPEEVNGTANKNKRRREKKCNKRTIEMPADCIQALRDHGLVASDELIKALVNTLRVQPKRFKKLGLLAAKSASEPERANCERHAHGRPQRGYGKCEQRERERERCAPEDLLPSKVEWAASLPENSRMLFEQAALRSEIQLSARELRMFMQLLRLPLNRLVEAGLLSEREMRGDGTGTDKCVRQPAKGDRGLSRKTAYYAPSLAQKLQEHDLVLDPLVLQQLMELLRVRPYRFLRAGLIDKETWHEQRKALHAERTQEHRAGGFGHWLSYMMRMTSGDSHRRHRHHDHQQHQQQSAAGESPTMATPNTADTKRSATTVAACEATPVPTSSMCVMAARPMLPLGREIERRFPTNASMAQLVPVEGRQSGKVVSSGVRFEQRWKVQNNHTHCWPAVVEIVPDNEDAVTLGVREPVIMSLRVQPRQSVDIAIIMDAPAAPGLYRPRFRLRDGNTALAFGQRLASEVLVVDPNQPQQHEPQLPPRMRHAGLRRRMPYHSGGASY